MDSVEEFDNLQAIRFHANVPHSSRKETIQSLTNGHRPKDLDLFASLNKLKTSQAAASQMIPKHPPKTAGLAMQIPTSIGIQLSMRAEVERFNQMK